eukprot:TRINITY_DN75936_c0_g1_i1.p2 TRINITY_DN75936_c0_g1~~TRINITY_DN75936_c0_g1_i1.p2  ORF type:complete len:208 (+),score=46.81 TRINITY_DN75936_c0_g1_i1:1032-1655(+)
MSPARPSSHASSPREGACPDEVERVKAELVAQHADLERCRLELEAQQADMERRKEELSELRAQEQEEILSKAETLLAAEAELKRRADALARTERAVRLEHEQVARGRASLAVVQAHVVSMLDKAGSGGATADSAEVPMREHRLDDPEESPTKFGDESEDDGERTFATPGRASNSDAVWNMDWTSGFPDRSPGVGKGQLITASSPSGT